MSKRDYYEVLGLAKNATEDDIKKAYRKLSSAHHPDKHTTASETERAEHEAKFKDAKEAYETLSDPQKRASYDAYGHSSPQEGQWRTSGGSDLDDILEQLRRGRGGFSNFARGNFKQVTQFQAGVSLKEAFEGFSVQVQLPDGSTKELKVPPGTPDGYRHQVDVMPNLAAIIITRIHDDKFSVKNPSECGWHQKTINGRHIVVIETGDIETTVKVDAIDLMLGTWVTVPSFEGEKLQVRIPSGMMLAQRLKVRGKGYYHWLHELGKAGDRGDMYVKVEPVFSSLKDIPLAKVEELYNAVKAIHPVTKDQQ